MFCFIHPCHIPHSRRIEKWWPLCREFAGQGQHRCLHNVVQGWKPYGLCASCISIFTLQVQEVEKNRLFSMVSCRNLNIDMVMTRTHQTYKLSFSKALRRCTLFPWYITISWNIPSTGSSWCGYTGKTIHGKIRRWRIHKDSYMQYMIIAYYNRIMEHFRYTDAALWCLLLEISSWLRQIYSKDLSRWLPTIEYISQLKTRISSRRSRCYCVGPDKLRAKKRGKAVDWYMEVPV